MAGLAASKETLSVVGLYALPQPFCGSPQLLLPPHLNPTRSLGSAQVAVAVATAKSTGMQRAMVTVVMRWWAV